jgi:hypothetical protein
VNLRVGPAPDNIEPMDSLPLSGPELLAPGVGWEAFTDLAFIGEMLLVLAMAIALAAVIAYHPTTRRKASTVAELEQPKTFIVYAMVGAILTIIVKTMPSMALVVFGIGGLMRFRTEVGEAKDTGRVILVTVIGLACGLELYVVAVLTTVLAWLLIYTLERHSIERLVIQGLDAAGIARASVEYVNVLRELGCTILGEDRRANKGCLAIIFRSPRGVRRAHLEKRFAELPESKGDTLRWERS